jgi:hypothetical protein
MHTMKSMYAGEILVLGNARIRPWDVCILADSYNDMVGPIEVEAVVHNFSFETGFTTEIKPGAIVIANEISTWPLLEGMKLWALAVKDMEHNYGGIGDGKGSLITTSADWIRAYGAKSGFEGYVEERYKEEFGGRSPWTLVFGDQVPEQQNINSAIESANALGYRPWQYSVGYGKKCWSCSGSYCWWGSIDCGDCRNKLLLEISRSQFYCAGSF